MNIPAKYSWIPHSTIFAGILGTSFLSPSTIPPRHALPVAFSTSIAFGGFSPLFYGSRASVLEYGFPPSIADQPGTWPVNTIWSARMTVIGSALLGMYAIKDYRAMDILFAAFGWICLVDSYVHATEGRWDMFWSRGVVAGFVSLWGLLGVTRGKAFWTT